MHIRGQVGGKVHMDMQQDVDLVPTRDEFHPNSVVLKLLARW